MSLNIETLKEKNQANTEQLNKPYQPLVYAVPQDQWEAMLSLMKDNLTTLPTMTATLKSLPTARTLQDTSERIVSKVILQGDNLRSDFQSVSRQVGKNQESLAENQEKVTNTILHQFKQMKSELLKMGIGWLALQVILLVLSIIFLR